MANRLAHETSPYLQQHAENPVDWYPWGEEALALARTQDRPILLSVGYSACHWCHVMAHESFEDPEVAAEMNRHFVNVKVDREERPDLDHIYQTAHHMLTRRAGGWPLTLFLMPDGTPFFAGTYFPQTARYGMPGFRDLLGRIADAYRNQRDSIAVQNASLMEAFANAAPGPTADVAFERAPVDEAVRDLAEVFDRVHGGIGSAPKFPHPFELAFCLRRQALDGDTAAGEIARLTLSKMAEGGINDQLGGGFCRYSTDPYWSIPHFEKMLYDNGPLLGLYVDAWRVTRDPLYEKTVRETAAWVLREMQAPIQPGSGGYYSSLDADSEGVEGKFYVWSREAVQALLSDEKYAVAAAHYGLDAAPNFESRHWNLRVSRPLEDVAAARGLTLDACRAHLDSARVKLLTARAQRVRPGRDEKVLTSWNALMIKAMARAGRVFGRADWIASARGALEFLRARLWKDGRLLATCKDGRAHLNAYLDDHAFLLDALLEVMQTEFRSDDLHWAQDLADLLLDQFEDRASGGFYFVSHDHEALIHRPKVGPDNATPSGNGVAAFALQRLGHLVGEPRYVDAAERAIRFFYEPLTRNPSGYTTLLGALEEALSPPRIVVLRGPSDVLAQWQAHLAATFRPDTLIVALPDAAPGLPAALDKPPHATAAAWICAGVACLPPVFELTRVESLITPHAAPH